MSAPRARQGFMNLAIRDKNGLHAAYMPFIKNGGLFIPTDKSFALGDEVFLLLSLMDEPERHPITGKVIWISPKLTIAGRPAGIGVQFGPESLPVLQKIEGYLAGFKGTDLPTNTM